jgi:hypothetical protein
MMKGSEGEKTGGVPIPPDLVIYRVKGVYEKRHLCDYLRELSEDHATSTEEYRSECLCTDSSQSVPC